MDYFDELNLEAARLVEQATEAANVAVVPESIAVGEPDPQGAEADPPQESATPTILWAPQRRFLGTLAEDAQRMVQDVRSNDTPPPTERTADISETDPRLTMLSLGRRVNGLGPEILRLADQLASRRNEQAAPATVLDVRRSVWAIAPPAEAPRRVVYAIGAYLLPQRPLLPLQDYWRQWDNLSKEQADELVATLRQAGIPPRFWNGTEWVTL